MLTQSLRRCFDIRFLLPIPQHSLTYKLMNARDMDVNGVSVGEFCVDKVCKAGVGCQKGCVFVLCLWYGLCVYCLFLDVLMVCTVVCWYVEGR